MRNNDTSPEVQNHGLPSGLRTSVQDAIEVKFWEIYLNRSRANLNNILSSYALDKGPWKNNIKDPERMCFRFSRYDWDKSLQQMLVDSHMPFEIMRHFKVDLLQHISKKKVYVAEDDLNILFALNTMLENAGYDVILSHCGFPLMENHLPATDLFILDKRMPDVDGLDVCHHLRAQRATMDIPIVMISASRNFAQKAFEAGVNDCLEKPFDMKVLLGLVSKHTSGNAHHSVELADLSAVSTPRVIKRFSAEACFESCRRQISDSEPRHEELREWG